MKTQEIGQSGMIASRVALGVMRMDALDRDAAAKTVATAAESGIDYFDTADIYGFHAHELHASSRIFGQAWQDAGLDRGKIFIQTKFGIDYRFDDGGARGYDFTAKHLLDSLDAELEALNTDYVDAVLLHRIDTLFELDEVAEAFDKLESSGKVRHFGVSNMGPWQIELLQSGLKQKLEIDQLQFGLMHTQPLDAEIHFNVNDDEAADRTGGILPYSRLKHMTIQAWCPFQSDTEFGPFVGNAHFPELNAELDKLAAKYDSTPNGIAVAWMLRHPAGIQPLLGSMNTERIAQMAAGADIDLSREDWWDLYRSAGNKLI
ncbi:aldo/keto reductase [Bifidobacterium simiiventris]|uniref:aldo/keto reductase n=1 Tax=Bifidobacterium simiiventris TaxID=2834434 RepID=UPI001C55CD8E|nr:aldo/keto reductase [Bifidobacterium simiiventris]MBW3079208.1 aldo/keto reductase [Bifidobacterium simiiventris]